MSWFKETNNASCHFALKTKLCTNSARHMLFHESFFFVNLLDCFRSERRFNPHPIRTYIQTYVKQPVKGSPKSGCSLLVNKCVKRKLNFSFGIFCLPAEDRLAASSRWPLTQDCTTNDITSGTQMVYRRHFNTRRSSRDTLIKNGYPSFLLPIF